MPLPTAEEAAVIDLTDMIRFDMYRFGRSDEFDRYDRFDRYGFDRCAF